MFDKYRFSPFLAIGLMSACGGGSTTPTDPLSFKAGTFGTPFVVENRGDSAEAEIRGVPQLLTRNDQRDVEGFRAYTGNSDVYFVAFTGDEQAVAELYAVTNDLDVVTTPGSYFARTDGTLPLSGQAHYRGDYVGVIAREPRDNVDFLVQSYVSGDVLLNVTFGGRLVDGRITNRERYLTASGADASFDMEPVFLNETFLEIDGSFAGSTTGGKFDSIDFNPEGRDALSGDFEGAFSGDEAAFAVGIVQISHDYEQTSVASDDYIEYGAFTTDFAGEGTVPE